MSSIVLLGPQRPLPNLPKVLEKLGGEGPVAAITAGWRHDEVNLETLQRDAGADLIHIPLYAWYEQLTLEVPGIARAWRAQQARIQVLKEAHRVRLKFALKAARTLRAYRVRREQDLITEEYRLATEDVRAIDQSFLTRTQKLQRGRDVLEHVADHPGVAQRREEIRRRLQGVRAVVVAGGHVGVLWSRMRFFGLEAILREALASGVHIVAWSAGAMVLADRVVLFHDDPPEGPSDPELLDKGLGLFPGIVPLPHARTRLRLDDPNRVALMARRFLPAQCITLDNQAWLERHQGRWWNCGDAGTASILCEDGTLQPLQGRPTDAAPS